MARLSLTPAAYRGLTVGGGVITVFAGAIVALKVVVVAQLVQFAITFAAYNASSQALKGTWGTVPAACSASRRAG